MEDGFDLELAYVTERIIAVSFPRMCAEETYRSSLQDVTRMLKSKHADSYLVINLSERRQDLTRMNPKVMDLGWPDLHAPPLDKMCTICKAMECWLSTSPQHVVVIHCRGGKGRIGVIISSFVHFTDISASADQALERFAMRKFCDDKVSTFMTPSQKRYVWILNSLLTGSIKMNASPLFLHCVILHGIPNFNSEGACRPYLKVYQGMQVVFSSGIYNIRPGHRNRVHIVLQPAQLLKGDILVKCYHKNAQSVTREAIFSVQFHTGAVQGYSLIFEKEDLEIANRDARFPDYGKVELVLSESPEKIQGSDRWKNVPDITVDQDMADLLIRWDSYQNLSRDGEVPHVHTPPGLCTKVGQKNPDGSTPRRTHGVLPASSSDRSDLTLSTSSDSGLSSASAQTGHLPRSLCSPGGQEITASKRTPGKIGPEWAEASGRMTERNTDKGGQHAALDREPKKNRHEIDLLDDEVSAHDLCSMRRIGTLSPEGSYWSHHKSSQNSLLSDSCGSNEIGGEDELEQPWCDTQRNFSASQNVCFQAFRDTGYPMETWVSHQQMLATQQHVCFPLDSSTLFSPARQGSPRKPNGTSDRATGRNDSGGSTQRADGMFHDDSTEIHAADKRDKLSSLSVDIDQLNQLIMDLDPTFVPIPLSSSPGRRDAAPHENGMTGCSTNGMSYRLLCSNKSEAQTVCKSVIPASDIRGDRNHSESLQDGAAHHAGLSPSVWGLRDGLQMFPTCTQSSVTLQTDHVENRHRCEEVDSRLPVFGEIVPPTPAFPIPPPTPYVRDQFDFSQVAHSPQPSPGFRPYRTQLKTREFVENPDQDVPMSATLSSLRFAPTDGFVLWSESSSVLSHDLPVTGSPAKLALQYPGSPGFSASSLYHTSPSCHSSPKGAKFSLSSNPNRGSEKHDALHSGKEDVTLNGGLELPPLPEKRRVSQGEQSLGFTSPAPSGFSSTHNGSSVGTPFPSFQMEPNGQTASTAAPSQDGKQENAKFVQDTSKFWYKPDISRDQAIAILKDKEPGSFVVRDSHSFRGAYGLAVKVAAPPPSVAQQVRQGRDVSSELVRHFLVECTQRGVRLKGCPSEPYFGSLAALVCHHSVTPLALPCKLIIPDRDLLEEVGEPSHQTAANSAAELLKQGAACNVWFLGSVEMESLTGYQAVQKATSATLSMDPPPSSTVVHFKVSAQGITLTDNQRKLFFRRHYAVNTVIFCSLDPQDRRWTRDGCSSAKIFGFVARKSGSTTENVCHLFAEHDPEQPAGAVVNFISKVMIGSQRGK